MSVNVPTPCTPKSSVSVVTTAASLRLGTAWSTTDPVSETYCVGFSAAFEPTVRLTFDRSIGVATDLVVGPVLGLSLHYGPDYESDSDGEARGRSFWALGPILGGYFVVDFVRPGELFNFQLGLTPYVTPLFSVADPDEHKGLVVGGMLEGHFRFHPES